MFVAVKLLLLVAFSHATMNEYGPLSQKRIPWDVEGQKVKSDIEGAKSLLNDILAK